MKHLKDFFAFAEEREAIRQRKEAGEPWPWTKDEVLQRAFFCNIYREDDKTTKWFRNSARDWVAEHKMVALTACVLFRWFNKIETGEQILPWLRGETLTEPGSDLWRERLLAMVNGHAARGHAVFGAGYIISSPLGDRKIDWAVNCTTKTVRNAPRILAACTSLESAWDALQKEQGLGPFMSYEIVTDLRHTSVLRNAPDIMSWANPGPGCMRGLGWVTLGCSGRGIFKRNREGVQNMLKLMREIRDASDGYAWQARWEMREVEHVLCEFDKYRRVQRGDRPKRWYRK